MPARPYATPLDTFIHYAFTSHITTGIKYHSPSNSRLKFHSFTESWAHRYKYIVFVVRFNHFPVGHQQHFLRVLFLSLVRSVGRTRDWAVGSVECYSLQIFIRRSRFQTGRFSSTWKRWPSLWRVREGDAKRLDGNKTMIGNDRKSRLSSFLRLLLLGASVKSLQFPPLIYCRRCC